MGCKCSNIIRATSYTVGDSFNINANFSINSLTNCQRFTLVLPIDLPAMTTIVPVYVVITVNGTATNIPLQDVIGNNFMSDQLRNLPKNGCNCFGVARLIYGSNPQHFKVLNCVPSSSAISFDENGGNN